MLRNANKTDYSGSFPAGFGAFAVEDPRTGGNTRHHFGDILFMAFAARLCGVRSYELIEEFCELRESWLRKWLKLPNGLPYANTFSRVFQAIAPSAFAACIASHLASLGFEMAAGQNAIDGKTLRGSRSGGEFHVHAVSAWACEAGITLGQAFVGDKSNEITAIPEFLAMLNLIAADIVAKGGDYILCAKGNQGRLHDEVREQFDFAVRQLAASKLDAELWSVSRTHGSGHDRTETRSIIVCHNLDCMDAAVRGEWKNIGSVVIVHCHTLLRAGKTRSETSYYISSLTNTLAAEMLGYIRGHWGIENSCHWVLDAICREDHSQVRDLPKRELRAAQDEAYLEKLLSLV